MGKTKKLTKLEREERDQQKSIKKGVAIEQGIRSLFILGFAGNIASAIMYSLLVDNPSTGMYVLAGFNTITAGYFMYRSVQ